MKHKKTRTKGWLGTRVEVCGTPILTHPSDQLICLLPPNHTPEHLHAAVAMADDTLTPVAIIQNDDTEQITWLEQPNG